MKHYLLRDKQLSFLVYLWGGGAIGHGGGGGNRGGWVVGWGDGGGLCLGGIGDKWMWRGVDVCSLNNKHKNV